MAMLNGKQEAIEPSNSKLIIKKDFCMRILLFVLSLIAVVLMVTSTQTELIKVPQLPFPVSITNKYTDSAAFIYFVAALSLSTSYTFITALATLWVLKKPVSSKSLLNFFLLLIVNDVVIVGVVAAATGTAGAIAYIALKGDAKLGKKKVCNIYGKFCKQIGVSIGISLVVALLLVVLVVLSAYSVRRLVRKALN